MQQHSTAAHERRHPHRRRVTDMPPEERTAHARYQPGCTCGWQSVPVATQARAERVWRQHHREATAAW